MRQETRDKKMVYPQSTFNGWTKERIAKKMGYSVSTAYRRAAKGQDLAKTAKPLAPGLVTWNLENGRVGKIEYSNLKMV